MSQVPAEADNISEIGSGRHQDRVLILDFGGQYTQLIARRVREAGVYSEILPFDVDEQSIRRFGPKGIILSGGPESVTVEQGVVAPGVVFELGVRLAQCSKL